MDINLKASMHIDSNAIIDNRIVMTCIVINRLNLLLIIALSGELKQIIQSYIKYLIGQIDMEVR